jgi:hypothetical protein
MQSKTTYEYLQSHRYMILAAHTVYDPADATPYYFGLLGGSPPSGADIYAIPVSLKGTIRTVVIRLDIGTVGTNETASLYIRKNGTTDYLITTISYDTKPQTITVQNLAIPLDVGDYYSFKLVCPTWATNPLQVREVVSVYHES